MMVLVVLVVMVADLMPGNRRVKLSLPNIKGGLVAHNSANGKVPFSLLWYGLFPWLSAWFSHFSAWYYRFSAWESHHDGEWW